MNNKILIAAAALVVIAGLAIYKVGERADDSGSSDARKSAGDKLAKIEKDKIDELEVTVAGEAPVVMKKTNGTWAITAPLNAKPNVSNIEDAVSKLREISVRRVAASNPENHAALEVDDASGVRVIARGAGKVLRDIVIGKFGGGEQMLRKHDDEAVLAVKESLKWVFNKKLKDWRDRTITEADASQVNTLHIEDGDKTWAFRKNGGTWEPGEGQKAIEEFDPSKVSSLVSTFARLTATDFAAADTTPEQAGLVTSATKVTLTLAPKATTPTSDAGSADAGAAAGGVETIILRSGENKDGNVYVQREGNKLIYLVSSFNAKKFRPEEKDFQKSEEPEGGAPGIGAPPGGITAGPSGQANIPPDIMAKIQAQMAQQQQ